MNYKIEKIGYIFRNGEYERISYMDYLQEFGVNDNFQYSYYETEDLEVSHHDAVVYQVYYTFKGNNTKLNKLDKFYTEEEAIESIYEVYENNLEYAPLFCEDLDQLKETLDEDELEEVIRQERIEKIKTII